VGWTILAVLFVFLVIMGFKSSKTMEDALNGAMGLAVMFGLGIFIFYESPSDSERHERVDKRMSETGTETSQRPNSDAVDCLDLKRLGEARGDNSFAIAETVKNAERAGTCKW